MSKADKKWIEELLALAGIKINGDKPWDIQIHNDKFYSRVIKENSLGLGESYMDGWWDTPELDQFFDKIFSARLEEKMNFSWSSTAFFLKNFLFNLQTPRRAFTVGKHHYDVGNDLYKAMLDKRLVYTCGYWHSPASEAKTLDQAQEAKLDLVCRKINLKKDETVLDIGCGWGSFAKYAAEKYGAKVTGVTISKKQLELGKQLCEGLPVELRFQDYHELDEKFDKIVSLGMFEHVGVKNFRDYMKTATRCLKDDGLFLLHTIGSNTSVHSTDPWIEKYIFPNGMLPSIAQIGKAIEKIFIMEDWHNFGADYDKTLMAWFENFNNEWPRLKENYSEDFYRMWKYYLLTCAANFRSRQIQLWQIVLSKNGTKGGWKTVR